MFIIEDEDEAKWKNSEVMRIFAELYFDKDQPLSVEKPVEKTNNVSVMVVAAEVAPPILDIVKEELKSNVDQVIDRLARMAENTPSQKTAYLVERAIDEIRDIVAN